MSYILDALRKAEAQRAHGTVPGLHAPTPAWAGSTDAPTRQRRTLRGLGLLLVAGTIAWLGWRLGSAPSPRVTPPMPPPVAAAGTAGPAAVVNEAATILLPAAAPPAPPPALPAPRSPPANVAAATAAVAAPAPVASAAAAARIVPLAELPEALRRQLPPLALAGSVYSARAAERFVIINGQLLREGESPAPGLLLEQIGEKAAVLRWRETRFALPF